MKTVRLLLLFLLCSAVSCVRPTVRSAAHLQRTDWAPDVLKGLNDFLDDCSGQKNCYAVFDFDNTSAIFDIEEQLAIYQLETMSFEMTPDRLAEVISTGLEGRTEEYGDWVSDISAAYSELYKDYGPFTAEGLSDTEQQTVQSDPNWKEFSTKMRAMYDKVGDWVSADDSYNWILYWFTGMTEKQVYDLAYKSHIKYSQVETSVVTWSSPAEIKSKVGPVIFSWTRGVQVSANIRELWSCLRKNGIDVWLCSASGIDQVLAAVDAWGLREWCTGVLAMTVSKDSSGRYINEYDFKTGYSAFPSGDGWTRGSLPTKCQTAGPGKVTAICNSIAPLYGGATPVAGFMDSTGDFNFCTEFSSLKTVVCFNRADRKITDGGGLIAEVAIYEKETLGYDYAKAKKNGDTFYLLQGRDENGMRSFRPSNKTIRYGETQERLFAGEDNFNQLDSFVKGQLTVAEALNQNAHNFISDYNGYHSR